LSRLSTHCSLAPLVHTTLILDSCILLYPAFTHISTLSLHDALPISDAICKRIQTKYMIPYLKDGNWDAGMVAGEKAVCSRLDGSSAEHTSELQSRFDLVCRLLLAKIKMHPASLPGIEIVIDSDIHYC